MSVVAHSIGRDDLDRRVTVDRAAELLGLPKAQVLVYIGLGKLHAAPGPDLHLRVRLNDLLLLHPDTKGR